MKPSPDFIPHTEFHNVAWMLSEKRPGWYYYVKKEKQPEHEIQNDSFIDSVDPPLRELVQFLHERGITTTPSCSGHHKSERNFAKLYDDLKSDEEDIRRDGIVMKDIETGERFFFHDPDYTLPWSKEDFIDKVWNYQEKGILGFRVNGEVKKELLQLQRDGLRVEEHDQYLFFRIVEGDGDNRETWKWITKQVKSAFESQQL